MTSECIMKCQLFENLIKMTPFHLQYVTFFQTKKKTYISNCKKNIFYFTCLSTMQLYLTYTEKHLQKFGKLNFMILKNEVDVKFRRCYNDETP